MGGKTWPLENLRKFLADVDADLKITILDACHSGAFITTKGGIVSAPIRFREENDLQARGSLSQGVIGHGSLQLGPGVLP